jgi:virginiamycin B lyase
MSLKALLLATTVALGGALLQAGLPISAQAQTGPTITGQVSSTEEGKMEGVLVSAKKEGSTVTKTVVSNDKGEFSFAAANLEPGKYTITIRAVGYTLVGPKTVDLAAAGASADVKLAKAKSVVGQLSNAEWLMSVPGDNQIKGNFIDCQGCHTLQRVFTNPHTPAEWEQVFTRMGRYAPESTPFRPQLIVQGGARSERPRIAPNMMKPASEFLANVNLSNPDRPEYDFKMLPRPKGKATRVMITEYDLPRKEAQPHDVVLDADGHAWYTDFGNQFVGELDPKTGKVTDHAIPLLRAEQPKGSLDIEADPDGNFWVGLSYQGGAIKIDRKTKQVTAYPLNKEWLDLTTQTNMVTPTHMYVDGKVWMTDTATRNLYRLDIKTGQWENLGVSKVGDRQISGYGLPSDKDNNVYMMEFGNANIGTKNAKTGEVKIWTTPIQRSRPRRGRFDDQGRLWFAEYAGNAIGMFDPATERMKEYKLPLAWSNPYDVVPGKGGAEVWTGSMSNDHVSRLNTKTEEVTNYLLPHTTNIRRVFVDETGPRPVLWVGNNHGAAIVKVEPLD